MLWEPFSINEISPTTRSLTNNNILDNILRLRFGRQMPFDALFPSRSRLCSLSLSSWFHPFLLARWEIILFGSSLCFDVLRQSIPTGMFTEAFTEKAVLCQDKTCLFQSVHYHICATLENVNARESGMSMTREVFRQLTSVRLTPCIDRSV